MSLETNVVHTGDCFDVLQTLAAESVHAVVSDPPYGLAFMGRDWDDFEPKEYQEWCERWARECLRVLKPGGHPTLTDDELERINDDPVLTPADFEGADL